MQTAFFDALDRAAADEQVRAIVVTGAGDTFCPGGDINDLSAATDSGIPIIDDPRTMTYPLTMPKPLVAAINGACAGFGFVLAAMCDVRFGARGAKFTTSFARRGVAAEHAITYLLPRQIGLQNALDLLLSARVIDAHAAHAAGFLLRVVEPESVLDEALDYARQLAEWSSPLAMSVIRRQVYDDLDHDFETARQRSLEHMVRYSRRADFAEGIESFTQSRPPNFEPLSADRSTNPNL